ncbi:MAG: aspartate/glutamate racemase family protein [Pontimonas sp.]
MKTLGLLGGMSWESSVVYEKIINESVRDALGGVASADLIVRSFNFADIEKLQATHDWDSAGEVLARSAADLERVGAEAIVLCTNTMHRVADAIETAISVPLLHIVDATGKAIQATRVKRVALLGTRYTMEQPFYRDALAERYNLEVVVPSEEERDTIHSIIYDELVQGIINLASREQVLEVIARMSREDAVQGVIAGCTEIELLVTQDDLDVPYFPTTTLHARHAANFALGQSD